MPKLSPDHGRTLALVGGQADMPLDPATGAAAVIGVYRGNRTECAPRPKVTVLQRAYGPAWLGRASSKRWCWREERRRDRAPYLASGLCQAGPFSFPEYLANPT